MDIAPACKFHRVSVLRPAVVLLLYMRYTSEAAMHAVDVPFFGQRQKIAACCTLSLRSELYSPLKIHLLQDPRSWSSGFGVVVTVVSLCRPPTQSEL